MNDLKNQKILFAPELENEEYGGIAFYFSLIKALTNSGQLWLVTGLILMI